MDQMSPLIPWSQRFTYTPLQRLDLPTGRVYAVPEHGPLPSVTTILDRTKDKAKLLEWAERIGQAEAERQKKAAAYIGTHLHQTLEAVLLGAPLAVGRDWPALKAQEMAFKLVNAHFGQLSEIHGSEVGLHYRDQYAGTTDLVATYRGRLAIIDFKQSVRPKRREFITDYLHQLAAYALAHDSMFDTRIDFAAVLIAVQDGSTQEFTTTGREFEELKAAWLKRVTLAAVERLPSH
jgi:genome maintenance exonuclease 1